MGWIVSFLRSNAKSAFDVISKEIYKKFWNVVVFPLMAMLWSFVRHRITEFGGLRNSFLGFSRKILPEPNSEPSHFKNYFCYCLTVLVVPCCVLVGVTCVLVGCVLVARQCRKMWTREIFLDLQEIEKSTMPSVKAAINKFEDNVMQSLDSREGHNFTGKPRAVLTYLNSELNKFERTTVTYEQLAHLNNMKRILVDIEDEDAIIFCHAKNCSAIITSWEDLLRNKQTPAVKEKMPRSEFSGGNPLFNACVDGFLKIGFVAATRAAAEDAFHDVKKGSVSKHSFEHTLTKMCKEGAYWGAVAGVYVGAVYGVERIRGRRDWKNAMIGGALTGAVISAATSSNKDRIVVDAITGGAIATAAEFLNYLTGMWN